MAPNFWTFTRGNILRLSLLFLATLAALAMGPRIPHLWTWTYSPDADGYLFYYRATNQLTYLETQRVNISTNQPYDSAVLGLAKGKYFIVLVATNLAGMQSDPSVEVLWDYTNPNKPGNLTVTP